MSEPRTMFDKIWDAHVVFQEPGSPAIFYIDRHLIHEVTSPQAFQELRDRGLKIHDPNRIKATIDHCNPTCLGPDGTEEGSLVYCDEQSRKQIRRLEENCREFGVDCYGLDNPARGVIHVFAPDMGLIHPGMTVVCGDSHTATHGAFGALAFGIGTSEVAQVMGTQCLLQRKPLTMRINYHGMLPFGTTAKDLILYTISQIGVSGGTNYAIEFSGEAIQSLSMEGRMTLCNMAIEAGARTGMVAPDEVTFDWLRDRAYAPKGAYWDKAIENWKKLPSDPRAKFDKEIDLVIDDLEPMATWGTTPAMGCSVQETVPDAENLPEGFDPEIFSRSLKYMEFSQGEKLIGKPVQNVFIGSCTNGRIEDLRLAASVLKDEKIADGVLMYVVPGSGLVKRQAEQEGLDKIFIAAGAEWREPGCSLCLSMNGDVVEPGKLCVSTSNRNFEGRQGPGARTVLASPATAAASAIRGFITDPREFLRNE